MSDEALTRAWERWLRPLAAEPVRSLDAAFVDADLRRALIAEAFGGAPPNLEASTARELLERIDALAWGVVLHAAERSVWFLPSNERDAALRDFAIAFATFPPPRATHDGRYDAWYATERLRRALVADRSERAARAFLDAALALKSDQMLLLGAPLLEGAAHDEAIDAALDAAAEFPDLVHRGGILANVVLHAPDRFDRAVARARAMDDGGETLSSMLWVLARDLSREHVPQVLAAAPAVQDEWSLALLLAELRDRLPKDAMARWRELADSIRDDEGMGLRGILEPPKRPPPDAPPPQSHLADAVNAWLGVARDVVDTPTAHEIARAVVRFVRETAELRTRLAEAAAA